MLKIGIYILKTTPKIQLIEKFHHFEHIISNVAALLLRSSAIFFHDLLWEIVINNTVFLLVKIIIQAVSTDFAI